MPPTSEVLEKIDLIDQLMTEMNEVKASAEESRSKIYILALKWDDAKDDLASTKE